MSTVPPPPTFPPTQPPQSLLLTNGPPSSDSPNRSSEIKLISHSMLFYWWPVWAIAFALAIVTWMDATRMAIVPSGTEVKWAKDAEGNHTNQVTLTLPNNKATQSLAAASGINESNTARAETYPAFRPRMSEKSWPGAIFVVTLLVTIFVTNVPLRGLMSFLVIGLIIVLALVFALLDVWDRIFETLGNLHIHINMAGYMTIGGVTFVMWALATYFFDRRSYVIFTPGQVRVCEHIGSSVQAFSTAGVSIEKQRDDLFRHYIFGFGSGDLIVKMTAGDRREVRMPNVLFLGWQMSRIENIMRSVATT